jgi:hypothetical protein
MMAALKKMVSHLADFHSQMESSQQPTTNRRLTGCTSSLATYSKALCTEFNTYSLGAPELPPMATTAVEKHVTKKQLVILGVAHCRTPLPWYCHTQHVLAYPHSGMLNTQQLLQF